MAETRYADNDGTSIAYRVIGDGAIDLSVNTWVGGLEVTLEHPLFVAFIDRLAAFSRVIRHDTRATGLSDHSRRESEIAHAHRIARAGPSNAIRNP